MALPSAQSVAEKWQRNASGAQQDYVAGAQNTDKDPTALAIAAGPRYIAEVTAAYNSGKYAAGLRRAGKQGWLNGITTKGATNFATGVQAAQAKYETAIASVLSFEQNLLTRLASMPSITAADRDARALFWIREMRNYVKPS